MDKKNKNIYNVFLILFIISIILEANSIYSQIYGAHLIIRTVFIIVAIICGIYLLLNAKVKSNKISSCFIMYILCCSGLMLFNTTNTNGYGIIGLIFVVILPLFILILSNMTEVKFKDLANKFINIVMVLCIVSLIIWILSSILHLITPNGTLKVIWAKPYSVINTYSYIHFDTQDVWWITGSSLIRNTGIFTEGPMYALVLIIALVFNNVLFFENTKKNFIKTIILFITMISTLSVTGVICALIIILSNYREILKSFKKKTKNIVVVLSVILLIIAIPLGINLMNKKNTTLSAKHRNMDISNGINAFLEKPLLGYGINHEREYEENPEDGYGYSNTIIPIMTDGGIALAIIYIVPFIFTAYSGIKYKNKKSLLLSLIYCIILFTTLAQYRLILMLLIAIMMRLSQKSNFVEEKIDE